MQTIDVFWSRSPRPGNLGDIVTPYLLHKMGYKFKWVSRNMSPKLLCVGSILEYARQHDTVWGTGAMWSDRLYPDSNATFLAVRGPLTRDIIVKIGGQCPEIYGDPALLLPMFYKPENIIKQHDIGFVAHYVDYSVAKKEFKKVINPLTNNIEYTINEILSCRKILSSSLHGLIVAEAYGIPWEHIVYSNKLSGDGTKFEDFKQSLKYFSSDKLLEVFYANNIS